MPEPHVWSCSRIRFRRGCRCPKTMHTKARRNFTTIPWGVFINELRYTYLPPLVFGSAIGVAVVLWREVVPSRNMTGNAVQTARMSPTQFLTCRDQQTNVIVIGAPPRANNCSYAPP